VELGNEEFNDQFVPQVLAMEARVRALGAAWDTYEGYIFPLNSGVNTTQAQQLQAVNVDLPPRIAPDLHVGATGGVESANGSFAQYPGFPESAVNAETNAGSSHMWRAIQEASDLNDWFSTLPPLADRLLFRTASFCMERSGHFDSWDQGLVFFLPNQTWFAPPGYVHTMITGTWGDVGLGVRVGANTTAGPSPVSVSAQQSSDGSLVFVRVTNAWPFPMSVKLAMDGRPVSPLVEVVQLSSSDYLAVNTPGQPEAVAPVKSKLQLSLPAAVLLPGVSYTVYTFTVV